MLSKPNANVPLTRVPAELQVTAMGKEITHPAKLFSDTGTFLLESRLLDSYSLATRDTAFAGTTCLYFPSLRAAQ